MPSLPITDATPLDGGALPVNGTGDVLAVFPAKVRRSANAPVRDALVAAFTEIQKEYQRRARYACAQSDILRATGSHLTALASDREVFKQPGEEDEALRLRLLLGEDGVTPALIMRGVNAILAPFTPKRAKYFESELDQMFLSESADDDDQCFVNDGLVSTGPRYLWRLYEDDAGENEGDFIEHRDPGGAWVFAQDAEDGNTLGRYFVIRLPVLDQVDELGTYVLDALTTDAEQDMMFLGDGSDTSGSESDGSIGAFLFNDDALSDEVYAAIVSFVEGVKGQGMRWQAFVDLGL